MKFAHLFAVLIGAFIGFWAGDFLVAEHLRNEGVYDAFEGVETPYLRGEALFSVIGALIGAGVVYVLYAVRRA